MPDTKPTKWADLSKEEIIRRKDDVIDQLTQSIEEMDKDPQAKARKCVEMIEALYDTFKDDASMQSACAGLKVAIDGIRVEFDIEEKKSEEEKNNEKRV